MHHFYPHEKNIFKYFLILLFMQSYQAEKPDLLGDQLVNFCQANRK